MAPAFPGGFAVGSLNQKKGPQRPFFRPSRLVVQRNGWRDVGMSSEGTPHLD